VLTTSNDGTPSLSWISSFKSSKRASTFSHKRKWQLYC
jgi:hypothetical protein